jgi:pimeloyl-ACP methyl ester carboxylesterase
MPHNAAPVVLFCPGTAGNLSSHLHYVELLCRAGCAVLGFDYTGFGQSAGKASLRSLVPDALSASDFLRQAKHAKSFGIFGISIGASVALKAAVLRPEAVRGVAVEGVAIQSEVVRGILAEGMMGPRYITAITYEGRSQGPRVAHLLNPLPVGAWLVETISRLGTAFFPLPEQALKEQTEPLKDIPVLFIHGVEDPLLPFEGTLQMYTAKPGEKRLWLIPRVGHAQEPILAQDAEYAAQLGDFFHNVLPNDGRPDPAMRPMTCEVLAQGPKRFRLRLHNPGPPGLALTTIVSAQTVDLRTLWVHDWAEVPDLATGEQPLVSCCRLFEVAGCGDAAAIRLTARGRCYQEVFQPTVRELSRALHESRLQDLDRLLGALSLPKPEAPFDFLLGVYCVQIMRRTQHKLPHIARAAAEAFCRYWPYDTSVAASGPPTPWDLAAAVLGKPVGLRYVPLPRKQL